jgi:hypothetical protein
VLLKSDIPDFLVALIDVLLHVRHQVIELFVLAVLLQQLGEELFLLLRQEGQVLDHRALQFRDHLLLGLDLLQLVEQTLSVVDHEKLGQFAGIFNSLDLHVVLLQPSLECLLLLMRKESHPVYFLLVHVHQAQLADLLFGELVEDDVVVDQLKSKEENTSLIECV